MQSLSRLALCATILMLGACGGGTATPELLAQGQTDAAGGNALQPAAVAAAPLVGMQVHLQAPQAVRVTVQVTWRASLAQAAELQLSGQPGTAAQPAAVWVSAGAQRAGHVTAGATYTWLAHLPQGTSQLQGVVRLRTSLGGQPAAALQGFTMQARWAVHAE